jgi:4-amino-4-deoxy-L-arabinose transferase-like glycosyltransferase
LSSATRNFSLLFFGALLFHLAGTWLIPLVDRDEPRFAEASREMIERGDYVVPFFNDRYRFDKPPLTYWCQVASYRLLGENDFAARLPSAVAAALVAVALFAWGKRLGLARAGFLAAIIFSLCLQVFIHAKAAVADMWLVLFVTLAHWAGEELRRDRFAGSWRSAVFLPNDTRRWWWILYLSLALGFLAKGPIGWMPLGTVAIMQLLRPVPQFGRRFLFVRGIFLTLAIVALWGVPALLRTHGEFFAVGIGRHVVGRSLGAMEGHGSNSILLSFAMLPFYFVTVFLSFAPWSLKLPWLTRRLWKNRDALDLYFIVGIAIVFIIFSLVRTKLPHYTLPAFPLLALLLARHWMEMETGVVRLKRWSIATAAVWLAVALVGFPLLAPYFPAAALFKKAEPFLQPSMDFAARDFEEPSLVWVFRSRVRGWMIDDRATSQPDELRKFLAGPGAHFIVVPTALADRLYQRLPDGYRRFSIRGFNIPKGRCVELTLILKNA